jgi:hypothetical protein
MTWGGRDDDDPHPRPTRAVRVNVLSPHAAPCAKRFGVASRPESTAGSGFTRLNPSRPEDDEDDADDELEAGPASAAAEPLEDGAAVGMAAAHTRARARENRRPWLADATCVDDERATRARKTQERAKLVFATLHSPRTSTCRRA